MQQEEKQDLQKKQEEQGQEQMTELWSWNTENRVPMASD